MVIGLVGRGRWGQILERVLKEDKRVDAVLVRGRHWRDLLEETRVSGVVVACRADAHAEIAEAFLERGTPLFIEKPLAMSREEAERIAAMAEQRPSVPVLVDHTMLFSDIYLRFREAVRDELQTQEVTSLSTTWTGATSREDCAPVWDYAPHVLALLLDLFGNELSFEWEPRSTIHPVARFAVGGRPLARRGEISAGMVPDAEPVRRLRFWTGRGPATVTFDFDDVGKRATVEAYYGRPVLDVREETPPLTNAVRVFLDAIEGKPDERLGLALGVRVVRVIAGLERASERG